MSRCHFALIGVLFALVAFPGPRPVLAQNTVGLAHRSDGTGARAGVPYSIAQPNDTTRHCGDHGAATYNHGSDHTRPDHTSRPDHSRGDHAARHVGHEDAAHDASQHTGSVACATETEVRGAAKEAPDRRNLTDTAHPRGSGSTKGSVNP
jgi:hypothetical protein